MTHRERVECALDHLKPDRCPMQISYTPEFENYLLNELIRNPGRFPNKATSSDPFCLEIALDQDLLLTWSGRLNKAYKQDRTSLANGTSIDEWGIRRKKMTYETRYGIGTYSEMIGHPLADESEITRYQPPDPHNPALYEDARYLLRHYQKEYWIVGCVVTTVFETAWALRGYEQLMIDLLCNPDLAERLLDIPMNYHLDVAKRLTELGVDMIWFGDDVGAQHSMLISPETWRKFFKPRMAGMIDQLKRINPRLKIAYHSDGYILPIIPDLIEIGVDVLNPIQPLSMNPQDVKKKFGDKLCLWGVIDEQEMLPFASTDEIETKIRYWKKTLGKDGGLILSPTHNVQLDTPPENFWTMIQTIRED